MPKKRYPVGRFACSWPQDCIDVVQWWADIHETSFSHALLDCARPRIDYMRMMKSHLDRIGHMPANFPPLPPMDLEVYSTESDTRGNRPKPAPSDEEKKG